MEENTSLFSLSIDPVTRSHLTDVARWARFLSLCGMLVLVLGMVVSILDATILDHSLGVAILINGAQSGTITPTMRLAAATGTVILTALAFFPLYYLFLFSRRMLRALAGKNQSQLNQSFLELKKCMRYLGILLLVGIAVFALVFVIAAMVSVA